jgi:hypothetical protein
MKFSAMGLISLLINPGLHISYFNPHFPFREQATISWIKLRKCGVFGSAFFCVPGMFGTHKKGRAISDPALMPLVIGFLVK